VRAPAGVCKVYCAATRKISFGSIGSFLYPDEVQDCRHMPAQLLPQWGPWGGGHGVRGMVGGHGSVVEAELRVVDAFGIWTWESAQPV